MTVDTNDLRTVAQRLDDQAGYMADAGKFSILVREAADQIDAQMAETMEHARLLGMSGERELALRAQRDSLRIELKALYLAYVRLLESGRDRITSLGGDCDPVDVMEAQDPALQAARAAINGADHA